MNERVKELILKLDHSLDEIKIRALKNIDFKLSHSLIDPIELCYEPQALKSILNMCNNASIDKTLPLKVIQTIASSSNQGIESLLQMDAVNKLKDFNENEMNNNIVKRILDKLLSYKVVLPIKIIPDLPRPSTYVTQSHQFEIYEQQENNYSWKYKELGREFNIAKDLTVLLNNTDASSSKVDNIEEKIFNHGWHFPLVQLSREDEQLFFDFSVQFKIKERETLKVACKSIREILIHDFPAEIFIQKIEIVKSLLALQTSPHTDSSIADQALLTLSQILTKILNSLYINIDTEMKCLSAKDGKKSVAYKNSIDCLRYPSSSNDSIVLTEMEFMSFSGFMYFIASSLIPILKSHQRVSTILPVLRMILPYLKEPTFEEQNANGINLDILRLNRVLSHFENVVLVYKDPISDLLNFRMLENESKPLSSAQVSVLQIINFIPFVVKSAYPKQYDTVETKECNLALIPDELLSVLANFSLDECFLGADPTFYESIAPFLMILKPNIQKTKDFIYHLTESIKIISLQFSSPTNIEKLKFDEMQEKRKVIEGCMDLFIYAPNLVTNVASFILRQIILISSEESENSLSSFDSESGNVLYHFIRLYLRFLSFPSTNVQDIAYKLILNVVSNTFGAESLSSVSLTLFMKYFILHPEVTNMLMIYGSINASDIILSTTQEIIVRVAEIIIGVKYGLDLLSPYFRWIKLHSNILSLTCNENYKTMSGLCSIMEANLSENDTILFYAMEMFNLREDVRIQYSEKMWRNLLQEKSGSLQEFQDVGSITEANFFKFCDPFKGKSPLELLNDADSPQLSYLPPLAVIYNSYSTLDRDNLLALSLSPSLDLSLRFSTYEQLYLSFIATIKKEKLNDSISPKTLLSLYHSLLGGENFHAMVSSPASAGIILRLLCLLMSNVISFRSILQKDTQVLLFLVCFLFHKHAHVRGLAGGIFIMLCMDTNVLRGVEARSPFDVNQELFKFENEEELIEISSCTATLIPVCFSKIYALIDDNKVADSGKMIPIIFHKGYFKSGHGERSTVWRIGSNINEQVNLALCLKGMCSHSHLPEKVASLFTCVREAVSPFHLVKNALNSIKESSSHKAALENIRTCRKMASVKGPLLEILGESGWLKSIMRFIQVPPSSELDDILLGEVLCLVKMLLPVSNESDITLILFLLQENLIPLLDLSKDGNVIVSSIDEKMGLSSTSQVRELLTGYGYSPHIIKGVSKSYIPRKTLRMAILSLSIAILNTTGKVMEENLENNSIDISNNIHRTMANTSLVHYICKQYICPCSDSNAITNDINLQRKAVSVIAAIGASPDFSYLSADQTKDIVYSLMNLICRHRLPDSFACKGLLRVSLITLKNVISNSLYHGDIVAESIEPMQQYLKESNQGMGWLLYLLAERENILRASAFNLLTLMLSCREGYEWIILNGGIGEAMSRTLLDLHECPLVVSHALDSLSAYLYHAYTDESDLEEIGESFPSSLPLFSSTTIGKVILSLMDIFKDSKSFYTSVSLFLRTLCLQRQEKGRSVLFTYDIFPRLTSMIKNCQSSNGGVVKKKNIFNNGHSNEVLSSTILEQCLKETERSISSYVSLVCNVLGLVCICLLEEKQFHYYASDTLRIGDILISILISKELNSFDLNSPIFASLYNTLTNLLISKVNEGNSSFIIPLPSSPPTHEELASVMSNHINSKSAKTRISVTNCLATMLSSPWKLLLPIDILLPLNISDEFVDEQHHHSISIAILTKFVFNFYKDLAYCEKIPLTAGNLLGGGARELIVYGSEKEVAGYLHCVSNCLAALFQNSHTAKETVCNAGGVRFFSQRIDTLRTALNVFNNDAEDDVKPIIDTFKVIKAFMLHSNLIKDCFVTSRFCVTIAATWKTAEAHPVLLEELLHTLCNFTANHPSSPSSLLFSHLPENRLSELGRGGKSVLHSVVKLCFSSHSISTKLKVKAFNVLSNASQNQVAQGVLIKLDVYSNLIDELSSLTFVKWNEKNNRDTQLIYILSLLSISSFNDEGCQAIMKHSSIVDSLQHLLHEKENTHGQILASCLLLLRNLLIRKEYKSSILSCSKIISSLLDFLKITVKDKSLSLDENSILIKAYSANAVWAFIYNYQKGVLYFKAKNAVDILSSCLDWVSEVMKTMENLHQTNPWENNQKVMEGQDNHANSKEIKGEMYDLIISLHEGLSSALHLLSTNDINEGRN